MSWSRGRGHVFHLLLHSMLMAMMLAVVLAVVLMVMRLRFRFRRGNLVKDLGTRRCLGRSGISGESDTSEGNGNK